MRTLAFIIILIKLGDYSHTGCWFWYVTINWISLWLNTHKVYWYRKCSKYIFSFRLEFSLQHTTYSITQHLFFDLYVCVFSQQQQVQEELEVVIAWVEELEGASSGSRTYELCLKEGESLFILEEMWIPLQHLLEKRQIRASVSLKGKNVTSIRVK